MTTSVFPGQGRTCAAFIALLALAAAAAPAATITVNSTADAGGTCPGAGCTLRQAIAAAASNDTINFAADLTTITLTSDELLINKNLTITGPGANLLTVQRSTVVTQAFRIFEIAYGNINVTISGLTITNGNANSGPSGYFSITTGGGIYNAGTATITNSTVSGNSALYGGGIASFGFGTVTVTNSTISGNSAVIAGGIDNSPNSTVTITNSSISGNTAADGGGIFNFGGTITVTTSTIAGNSASKVSGNNVVPRPGGNYHSPD